LIMFLHG